MYIVLRPHIQNSSKFKRPPVRISVIPRHVSVGLHAEHRVSLENVYKEHLIKGNVAYTNWSLSLFQTGVGVVQGQLQENNKPISDCTLHLIQSSTGVKAATTYSDKDGNFKFTGIAADVQYFVIAVHKKRLFNAVVLDDVRLDSRVNYDQSEV